jgi:hypothetical protein
MRRIGGTDLLSNRQIVLMDTVLATSVGDPIPGST